MEEILQLISATKEPIRTLLLDASGIDDVDYTAAKMLLQIRTKLAKRGIAMAAVATSDGVLDNLRRYGIGDKGSLYQTIDAALGALREFWSRYFGGARLNVRKLAPDIRRPGVR